MNTHHRHIVGRARLGLAGTVLALSGLAAAGLALAPVAQAQVDRHSRDQSGASAVAGYVLADQPTSASYTPALATQYNSAGATDTITRSATGTYRVLFPSLASAGGTVDVTASGTSPANCKVRDWISAGANEEVDVSCFTLSGTPLDSVFAASFTQPIGPAGTLAYVWADQPSASHYTPNPTYQYNNLGGRASIRHLAGLGSYRVSLPHQGASAGTVKVTAYGSDANACKVKRWGPSGTGTTQVVDVSCYDRHGMPADSRFTMTFSNGINPLGVNQLNDAYVWANMPTTQSYTPDPSYQFNNQAGPVNDIARLATGDYSVKLPSQGSSGGHAQATAYGNGDDSCQVVAWSGGAAEAVEVRCFTHRGAAADTFFTVQWMTD